MSPTSDNRDPLLTLDFLRALPKTDLHVHLDGSLRLSSLLELAAEYHVDLPSYTEAGLLVRFLLGGDPARAERFRVFLRAAALGAPAGLDDLAAAVGSDATGLEKEYWSFVRRQ